MDLFKILGVSSTGMQAQRSRMTVVTGNMVNSETTRTPEGGPYKRRDVVFQAVPLEEESSTLTTIGLPQRPSSGIVGVEVAGVRESAKTPKRIYDPHHPDADTEGYVAYPDINVMEEMVNLITASRAYEGNITAMSITKAMAQRALEIGR